MYIRNVVLRRLLRYAPSNMLWCLTGSNMALAWMAIAEIPTNGYSLMNMTKQVRTQADRAEKYPQTRCRAPCACSRYIGIPPFDTGMNIPVPQQQTLSRAYRLPP